MQIKCPACHTEHDLEAGKYQCWCGKYFFVYEDGNVVLIKQKRLDFKIFQKKFQAESMVTVLACVIFILLISFVVVCITGEKTIKTISLPNGVKLDMVKIKAGSFLMGSPDDELGRSEDETLHKVTLTRDFWIGKYEVTQAQYEAVMGKEGEKEVNDKSIPALGISWIKAKEFCDKLNELYKDKLPSGYQFDLPTEAQWEYACRAGTTTALNDGTNLTNKRDCVNLDKLAWYFKKDSLEGYPVGQKKPNAWGLYDMHGNAREWCLDNGGYGNAGSGSPKIWGTADVIDPCYTNGEGHIIRGGSFYNDPDQCRSASRASYPQEWENIAFGFRLALVSKNNGYEDTSVQAQIERVPMRKIEFSTINLPRNIKLEMIKISAGTFMMGVKKQHQVTLTQDYWLGKYEVTQAQWEAVMGDNPSSFKGTNLPVEKVSWYDARKFCDKLNELYKDKLSSGYQFDLPTEAQWEYACRAGTTTAYFWGNSLNGDNANCNGYRPYGTTVRGKCLNRTMDVGSYSANPWGLYDMHGNVSEWCRDEKIVDLVGPTAHWYRMTRGGEWFSPAIYCQSGARYASFPKDRSFGIGFRLALVPVQ